MKKIMQRFVFILLLTLSSSLFAMPTEFFDLLNNIHSMQANFVQITYDNHGQVVTRSEGQMALLRPGQFRWQVVKPIPQLLIARQSRLIVYDPDLAQVTISSLTKMGAEVPALLLNNASDVIGTNFNYQELPQQGNIRRFLFVPKGADSMFARIEIDFNQSQIKGMILTDHLGHQTQVLFQHVKINVPVPANLFQFTPPPHVDVIDETKK